MSQSPPDFATDQPEPAALPDDAYHRLLTSERRRILLDVLAEEPMPVGLDTLAAAVAEREADDVAAEQATIEQVAVTLHHNHLPRMADLGVLKYEATARSVGSFRGV